MKIINQRLEKTELLLVGCILFQLTLSLIPFNYGDGFFRDELYQIAMSNHLGWGYVDVPPLSPFLLYIVRSIFGTSLFSLHLIPAIIGSTIIFLNYKTLQIFEAGFFAFLASLIPVTFFSILLGSVYTYDRIDFLIWNLMLFTIVKRITTGNKRLWIFFGFLAGLGLLTKLTVLLLGSGITIALVLTQERKYFKDVHLWMGGFVALVVFSPYAIWNFVNAFPTLDFFSNYATGKVIPLSPIYYISQQFLLPTLIPLWFGGICYLLIDANGKKFRLLGIAYIVILAQCILLNQKPYIPFPFLPLILAGGAVFVEQVLKHQKLFLVKIIYVALSILFCFYVLPELRPLLPLQTYIKYYGNDELNVEGHHTGVLKQDYADRFGWSDLAEKVAKVYNSLPEHRTETAIFASNYGEAGAIAFFGKKYKLPEPISGHNQYYLWGPRNYTGESMIVVAQTSEADLLKLFNSVTLADRTANKYSMPYENNLPIWICKKPKFESLEKFWSNLKNYN